MTFTSGCEPRNLASALLILGLFVLSSGKNIPDTQNLLDGSREIARDVQLKLSHSEDVFVGQDIVLTLRVENYSNSRRTLHINMAAWTKNENDVRPTRIKEDTFDVQVRSGIVTIIRKAVKAEDYKGKLNDQRKLEITFLTRVIETQQTLTSVFDIELRTPQARSKNLPGY